MSRIRSKWTKPERTAHNWLKSRKVRHKMHPNMRGNPDIFLNGKTLVFIDGCFWHGCPKHFVMPNSRRKFWAAKIRANRLRDIKNRRALTIKGWDVKRVWECQLSPAHLQALAEAR